MLDTLSRLSLNEPLWLLLAVVPWLLLAWQGSRRSYQGMAAFAEPHLWRWLLSKPMHPGKASGHWPLIVAWLLAVLALSGPTLDKQHTEIREQRSLDIALIIDISPSMAATDIMPSRLERAKLELHDFIDELENDRVALLAYSAHAYKILPLTHDKEALRYFINALDTGLTRRRGSNLSQALELAGQLLENSRQKSRAIVLVSDGETHQPDMTLATAQRLKKKNIPLLILGVGTASGAPVQDGQRRYIKQGNELVISRLDNHTLTALAAASGGIYTPSTNDDHDWQQVFDRMDTMQRENIYLNTRTMPGVQLYPWLLGISILLFLWTGGRTFKIAVIAFVISPSLMMAPQQADASPWHEQQAYNALLNKNYSQASLLYKDINTFNSRMGLGAIAYRRHDWQQAIREYNAAFALATNDSERARAAYNTGNALARSGDLARASRHYELALSLQSNFPRAALNLTLVNKAQLQISGERKTEKQDLATAADDPAGEVMRTDSAVNNDEINPAVTDLQTQNRLQTARQQWQPGNTGTSELLADALRQANTLDDPAHTILRQRISTQDARQTVLQEEKPW